MATVYDHLRDGSGVETVLTGRPPKRGTVSIKFTGTVAEFRAWLEATFKDYQDLPIEVRSWSPEEVEPEEPVRFPEYRSHIEALAALTHTTVPKAEEAFGPLLEMLLKREKIQAIKQVRTGARSGLVGLKEAKDWVETVEVSLRNNAHV